MKNRQRRDGLILGRKEFLGASRGEPFLIMRGRGPVGSPRTFRPGAILRGFKLMTRGFWESRIKEEVRFFFGLAI